MLRRHVSRCARIRTVNRDTTKQHSPRMGGSIDKELDTIPGAHADAFDSRPVFYVVMSL